MSVLKKYQDQHPDNLVIKGATTLGVTHTKRLVDMMDVANELASFFIPKSGFDKTVVYRAITHHYQVVFVEAPKEPFVCLPVSVRVGKFSGGKTFEGNAF